MAVTPSFHSLRGSVWLCGWDAGTRKAWCWEGPPTQVVPPTPGSAPAGAHNVLLLFSGSVRRASGLAACLQVLQVASASLDLIDTHLDVSLTTLCRRRAGHSTSWLLASFQGHAARLWDPEVHCENERSAPVPSRAHTHRQSVGGANRRGVQQCAFMRGEFLFCNREPAQVPRPCLTWRRMSRWHVPEPGAPTSGYRRLLPIARPSVRPCLGRSTSRKWKRMSTILPARSKPHSKKRWSATATRTPSRTSPVAVLCPLPVIPAPTTHTLQPLSPITCARTAPLRAQGLCDVARQGFPTTSRPGSRPTLARQRSRVQLTVDLAGPAPACQKDRQGTAESCVPGRHAAPWLVWARSLGVQSRWHADLGDARRVRRRLSPDSLWG